PPERADDPRPRPRAPHRADRALLRRPPGDPVAAGAAPARRLGGAARHPRPRGPLPRALIDTAGSSAAPAAREREPPGVRSDQLVQRLRAPRVREVELD